MMLAAVEHHDDDGDGRGKDDGVNEPGQSGHAEVVGPESGIGVSAGEAGEPGRARGMVETRLLVRLAQSTD